jgi:glutaminyl-peptide cyclotransferase
MITCVRRALFSLAAALLAVPFAARPAVAAAPVYGYQVVRAYPHDPKAFTEGLFYLGGYLFESTGGGEANHPVASMIRRESLDTGAVLQSRTLPIEYYGEGIVAWRSRLIELTWRNGVGFVYDLATFRPKGRFAYPGEGWALTQNGHELIMSDGTSTLRFLNPDTLAESHRITVTFDGQPVDQLNEIEWVKGEIFANVWMTDDIVRIDPATGHVTGVIDLSGLADPKVKAASPDNVLNGIAYDAARDRLFVTGKRWPKLFEIKLVKTDRTFSPQQ